jgi:hypothetical protein
MLNSILIRKISNYKIFQKKPINLIHIGAAESNFEQWKDIGQNSIIIILDGKNDKYNSKYKFKKIIKEDIFISNKNGYSKFYLTKDPGCSSLLKPKHKNHYKWYGSHRFEINNEKIVKTVSLKNFLNKKNIDYIDWFVIDIQGMDLVVYESLPKKIKENISIINIESGFKPFYFKEPKLSKIIEKLEEDYSLNDMEFGYNYIVSSKILNKIEKKMLFLTNKQSKLYANLIFLNDKNNLRTILIKIIFLIKNNKIFEAKNILLDNLKDYIELDQALKDLEKVIFIKKIYFIITLPYHYLKKYLRKILDIN